MNKQAVIQAVLKNRPSVPGAQGIAFAPANIALVKYWGKRDEELNLPVTASLSVSLGQLGSKVSIRPTAGNDTVTLNGRRLEAESSFVRRLTGFFDLFRTGPAIRFAVEAENTIPTAAGFASSASGFAAVVLALNDLFGWKLERRELSILARLGSGSACRSLYDGFVEWHAGEQKDGMDSFAEPLSATWPDLRMGLLIITTEEKATGSRAGMIQTTASSPLYAAWPTTVARDLATVRQAIVDHDFPTLGKTAEGNALAMHATMIAARPPLLYWKPESIAAMRRIWTLRDKGLPLYFTMDAGPNVKLIFETQHTAEVKAAFPEVQIVAPFAG